MKASSPLGAADAVSGADRVLEGKHGTVVAQRVGRVFPGYLALAGTVLAVLCTFNGHTFGIAWFLPGIREELGLDAGEIGACWSAAVFFAASGAPFVGKFFVDHPSIGPRRCLMVAGVLFGGVVACMGLVRRTEDGGGGVPQLIATIALMRLLGPVAVMISTSKALNIWFRRKRGRIAVARASLFHLMQLFPLFVSPAIRAVGWRVTYHWCGLIAALGISLCGCFCFHDGPLFRDGPSATNGWFADNAPGVWRVAEKSRSKSSQAESTAAAKPTDSAEETEADPWKSQEADDVHVQDPDGEDIVKWKGRGRRRSRPA